jgi:hypothetical protein
MKKQRGLLPMEQPEQAFQAQKIMENASGRGSLQDFGALTIYNHPPGFKIGFISYLANSIQGPIDDLYFLHLQTFVTFDFLINLDHSSYSKN